MKSLGVKNILVTGGSGKIGRAVLPEILQFGYKVRAIQFPPDPIGIEGMEIMEGTLADPDLAERALEDMDAVLHLANVKENREQFMSVNVRGTFCLLDACNESGHIQQYVQAGSDARAGIFYYPHPYPIDETYPHSAYPGYYAFSKVLEETMCEQFIIQYRLPITTLRFSWVYAEDDVLAGAGVDGVAHGPGEDDVVVLAAGDGVGPAVCRMDRLDAVHHAVLELDPAEVTEDHVVAGLPGDRIGAVAAEDRDDLALVYRQ